MLTVEYSFYEEEYRGDRIQPETWPSLSRDAAAWLDAVTFGRVSDDLDEQTINACRMAVCAAAEVLSNEREGGAITAETVGKWSRSYAADDRSRSRKLYDAAFAWLANAGLLYRGVTP